MFGKIHNNLREAIATSIPTKTLKGIKEAQQKQKSPKGLPGPFGVFKNISGAKALEANALKKQAGQKAKAKPKAQPKQKGKWVTNTHGIEVWHPPGYDPNNDPNKGWYFKEQIRNNAKTSPYRKNTWQPEGDMIGFYG